MKKSLLKKPARRKKTELHPALSLAGRLAGSVFLYVVFGLVLLFLLERQPSSFIYVSF